VLEGPGKGSCLTNSSHLVRICTRGGGETWEGEQPAQNQPMKWGKDVFPEQAQQGRGGGGSHRVNVMSVTASLSTILGPR